MTDTDTADTPDAAQEIQAVEVNDAPMTIEEAAKQVEARKSLSRGETPEAEVTEPEPEGEEEVPEAEAEAEELESEQEENDVLSQFNIDWDSLTEEQSAEMAYRNKSGGGKTIGKQRKEIRELKSKLETANNATKEAIAIAPASDNPYAKLHKAEEVGSALEQAQANVDFWDAKLDQAIDDEVYEVEHDGKSVSTKSIRTFVKEQRAAARQLKSRQSEIKKVAELFDTEDEKIETLRLDLGMEEGGKASKAYDKYLADPSFQLVKNIAPEYALTLLGILAHAAVNENEEVPKKKPAARSAPKAKNSNSVPKGGVGTPSNQSQLSVLERIIHDGSKPMAARKQAASDLRQLKSQIR